jgi:anti-sigma factor RsiW
MTMAVDGELGPRHKRALDAHVATCATCRAELRRSERLLAALDRLPTEAPVGALLEQATLRRVRQLAAGQDGGARRPWWWLPLPLPAVAIASAAVLVLAVGVATRLGDVPAPLGGHQAGRGQRAAAVTPAPSHARVARAERRRAPAEPPPQLADAPDLFVNLPILKNMEKLEHFEAIQTTTLDDDDAPDGEEQSNG